jgi:hypothetical protein
MRTTRVGLLAIGLLAIGCTSPVDNHAVDNELAEMIQDALKAGHQRHDVETYLSIWSDNAKQIDGRTEKPDSYDTILTREQFEAICKLRFAVPPPEGVAVNFENVRTEVKFDEATVRHRVSVKPAELFWGIARATTTDQVFRLRRKEGKWQIYESRSWPVEYRGDDYIEPFDAGKWEVMDDRVGKVQTQGELVGALQGGRRYAEAYAAAKEWTRQEGMVQLKTKVEVWSEGGAKLPEVWAIRGLLAVAVGEAADAEASFRRALELDPKANLPAYAKAVAKRK